jgi:hypothetical protein
MQLHELLQRWFSTGSRRSRPAIAFAVVFAVADVASICEPNVFDWFLPIIKPENQSQM